MELPRLTSIDGAYTYLMGSVLATAAVLAVYLVALYLGLVPGPQQLTGAAVVAPP